LATLLYREHPYGYPTPGTVAGLSAITLDDVKRFYAQHFTRERLILGVAGGYPEPFPTLRRSPLRPARWRQAARQAAAAALRAGMEFLFVEKPAHGNAISMGHAIDVTRADDDFYPLAVAASYLGEHRTFNGILMLNMRQKRGLNYGDYAYVENFIQDGWSTFPQPNIPRRQQHFEIWLRPVPPASAGFAIREAIYETDKLIRDGIPAAGFEATRAFLLNYINLWAQDGSRRLGYAIDAAIYGKDVIAELKARLPKMTKEDVDRAVRKHVSTANLAVVVVGDKVKESGRGPFCRQAHPHRLRHQGHARGRRQGRQDHRAPIPYPFRHLASRSFPQVACSRSKIVPACRRPANTISPARSPTVAWPKSSSAPSTAWRDSSARSCSSASWRPWSRIRSSATCSSTRPTWPWASTTATSSRSSTSATCAAATSWSWNWWTAGT
jgi:hypothetical protein